MSKKVEQPEDIENIIENLDQSIEISKETLDKPFEQIIEEKRLELFDTYKKSKKVSNIIMIITVGIVIGCFILISQNNQVCQIIGYILSGLVIVGMLVYYFLTKNKFPNATKEYIKVVTSTFNSFNYKATEYSEVKCDPDEKLELAEIVTDDIYSDLKQISSRNVIHGKFLDHSFLVADVALYSGSGKARKTDFVGKYLATGNDLEFSGKIVLNKKMADKPVDLPTNLDSLEVAKEEDNFIIYCSKELKDTYETILPKGFLKTINDIIIDDNLLNINVVVWAGHTSLYLSYCDAIIALPFEKPFDGEPMKLFEKQQRDLLYALVELFK